MTQTPSGFAKISPPRLGNYYPRQRLFDRLDEARQQPVIWISAPAGYGKSVLTACYLAPRSLDTIWCRLDVRDNDPGTFFYYLRQAAIARLGKCSEALPIMRAENLPGLSVFARNFFEQLYSLCKKATVIVFDNLQELTAQSPIMAFLPGVAEVLPETVHLIFLSRNQPPACMVRLRSHRQMELITSDDMALDQEEIKALAKYIHDITLRDEELHIIATQTHGWAAGVVLMLTQLRDTKTLPEAVSTVNETVFDYLATEVFERASPELQTLLLKTACLPEINNELASVLSGLDHAGEMLSELVEKNYFTYRQTTSYDCYYYHPLLQQFLLTRARKCFSTDENKQLVRQAAHLLAKKADLDNAAQLAIEGEDWELLGGLLLRNTKSLLQKGRYLILHHWFEALPDAMRASQPWLNYWYGNSLLPFDPVVARNTYIQAFEEFRRQNDQAGLYLAWAGVVDTYFFLWDEFISLDKWIAIMEERLTDNTHFPTAEVEAKVTYGMFCALMYRQPDHPDLPLWRDRVKHLITGEGALDQRLYMASQLTLYLTGIGRVAEAGAIVAMLKSEIQARANVQPSTLAAWCCMKAHYYLFMADFSASLKVVQKALDLADKSGVHLWDFFALAQGAYASLTSSGIEEGQRYLRQLEENMDKRRRLHLGHYHYLASLSAILQNALPSALEHARLSLSLTMEMGVPFPQALSQLALAQVYRKQSQYDRATDLLMQVRQVGRAMNSDMLEHQAQLITAQIAFEQNNESSGLEALRAAMTLGKKINCFNSDWWQPDMMAFLCGKALQYDIETEYIHRLIRKRRLRPSGALPRLENWPWDLKIYTLGRFSLVKDDQPLRFSTKAQKKPLEFLKVLIALGGREVSEAQLSEALWPDAEGDMARQNIKATLYRLRQLIGAEALTVHEGKISLDARQCWVDVWSLERRMTSQLTQTGEQGNTSADGISHLLELYRGQFLTGEDAPWVLIPRERLRSRLLRTIEKVTDQLINDQHYERAIDCYQRALEIDPLAERFYQGLMRANIALNRIAEALAVHRRCKEILSAQLGIDPSPETEALAQSLRA